jgi:opacity protein-like surface antigen
MKANRTICKLFLTCVFILTGVLSFGQATTPAQKEKWEFVLAPYVFMGSTSGDAILGVTGPSEIDLKFGDVLENLQFTFMLHGEVYKGNWGLMADYSYLRLGSEFDTPQEILRDITFKQSVFELFASRRFKKDWGMIYLYGGIRVWNYNLELAFQNIQISRITRKQDWVDPTIGGRVFFNVSNRFKAGLRADIGGFGLGSKFAFNLQPGIGYQFSDLFSLMLQYRYLYADFDNDKEGIDYFEIDASTQGPLLGLVFRF